MNLQDNWYRYHRVPYSNAGFRVPELTEKSYEDILVDYNIVGGGYRNPVESGSLRTEEAMLRILEILDNDENLDAIVQEVPLSRLLRGQPDDSFLKRRLNTLCEFGSRSKKPYVLAIDPTYPLVDPAITHWVYEVLKEAKVPGIHSFERTAKALWTAVEYHQSNTS